MHALLAHHDFDEILVLDLGEAYEGIRLKAKGKLPTFFIEKRSLLLFLSFLGFALYLQGYSREEIPSIPDIYTGDWIGNEDGDFLQINPRSIAVGNSNGSVYRCSTEDIYSFRARLGNWKDDGIFVFCDSTIYINSSPQIRSRMDRLYRNTDNDNSEKVEIELVITQRIHGKYLELKESVTYTERESYQSMPLGTFWKK